MDNIHDEEKLREASCYGDIFAMADLVRKGVNVNSANAMNGWTALHWACQRGHSSAVELLLRSGADPSLANHRNQTPAQLTALPHIRAKLGSSDPALTPSSPTNSPSHKTYKSELGSPVANGNHFNSNIENNNSSRSTTATPLSHLENCTTASSNDSIYGMSSKNSNSRSLSTQSSIGSTRSSKSTRSSRLGGDCARVGHDVSRAGHEEVGGGLGHESSIVSSGCDNSAGVTGHDRGLGLANSLSGIGYGNAMAESGHGHFMDASGHNNATYGPGHSNVVAGPGYNNVRQNNDITGSEHNNATHRPGHSNVIPGPGYNNGIAGPGHVNGMAGLGPSNGMSGVGHSNATAKPGHPNGGPIAGAGTNSCLGSERDLPRGNGVYSDPRRLSSSSCSSHSPPPLPSFRSSPPPLLSSPPSSPSPPPPLPYHHGRPSSSAPFSAATAAARSSPPPLPKSPTENDLELEYDSPDIGEQTPLNETSPRYAPEAFPCKSNFQNNVNLETDATDAEAHHFNGSSCGSPGSLLREQWHADFDGSGGVHDQGVGDPSPCLPVSKDYEYDVPSNENDTDDTFGQFIRDGQASFFASDLGSAEPVLVSSQAPPSQCSENSKEDLVHSTPLSSAIFEEDFSKQTNCPGNKGHLFLKPVEDQDHSSAFANIFCSSTVNYDLSLDEDLKETNSADSIGPNTNLFSLSNDKTSCDEYMVAPLPDNLELQSGIETFSIESGEGKPPTPCAEENDSPREISCTNEPDRSKEVPEKCSEATDITTNLIRFTSNLSLHNMADEAAVCSEKSAENHPISSLLDDPTGVLSPVDEILSFDPAVGNCVADQTPSQSVGVENPALRVDNSVAKDVISLDKPKRNLFADHNTSTIKQNLLESTRSSSSFLETNTQAANAHTSSPDAEDQRHSKGLQTNPEDLDPRLTVEKRSVSTAPELGFETHRRCCCCCCPRSHRSPESAAAAGAQEKTMVSRAVETDPVVPQVQEPEEIIIKIRVGGSDDPDFIEVPLPPASPTAAHRTYGALVQLCCAHLYLNPHHVQRIRKLPNTRLRNDADVARLVAGAELELVVGGRAGVAGRGGGSTTPAFPARPMLY